VVVVGGGYTGMMAASRLAGHGRSVALLEQHEIGWGASSRNGGMVHPGFKLSTSTLLRRYGPRGADLYQASLDAFGLVERTIVENRIDCDYSRSGHLALAHKPRQLPALTQEATILSDQFGVTARALDREALAAELGSDLYHGALLVERSGGLHPARYLAGLVDLARRFGAQLFERTPARAIERRSSDFVVTTPKGTLRAGQVLVATNGYTCPLGPALQRRIIPIGSYIIATEPLPPYLAKATIPNRRMLFDTKNFLYCWRLSPDDRMLFGGRASFAPSTIGQARDWLYAAMLRVHPQLAGIPIARAWGGQVGFTADRLPHIGQTDDITFALGYCGTGVAMSTYFGQLAADLILGDRLPDCWQWAFPSVPFYRGRPWFLRPLGWYYSALDRL
jgi:glycine/D-amino acid oxidase-like deaminating enzyme